MADEVRKPDETTVPIIGLIVLGLLIYGGYKLAQYIINFRQAPPPIVALSAYFADEAGNPVLDDETQNAHLKIRGQVQRPDNQATDGKVRVTVETLDQAFSQTLIIDTKGGNFETEDASLRRLEPDEQIYVKAEFLSSASANERPGELYLNTRPPKVTSDTLWAIAVGALVVVFIVFFYSFTGKKTPLKNRIAVIFSYCVIGIFLFLPLMAPVLLVPSDREAMTDRPVALVLTRVGPAADAKVQWALNIGGYATSLPQSTPLASSAQSPARAASPSPTPTARPTGAAIASPTAAPAESPATSPTPVQTPTRAQQPLTPAGPQTTSPTPTPMAATESDQNLVVDVQGGLVIPLYVIILSVIGGAINMTRKVPQLQEEGEQSEIVVGGFRPTLKAALNRIRHPFGGKKGSAESTPATDAEPSHETSPGAKTNDPHTADVPPPPPPVETATTPTESSEPPDDTVAAEIDEKVTQLLESHAKSDSEARDAKKDLSDLARKMKDLFDKRQDKKPIIGYESFEDWLKSRPQLKELFSSHWRVELLSQYMYLVSAPFLAIVAYYMLELAGLTKQPILVLISFSVGLVSERILSWLLGIASGYLRESPPQSGNS